MNKCVDETEDISWNPKINMTNASDKRSGNFFMLGLYVIILSLE